MSGAVNLFLHQCVLRGVLPFNVEMQRKPFALHFVSINYPGASTQALCSAPTSPLTALAFRPCSRKDESGV